MYLLPGRQQTRARRRAQDTVCPCRSAAICPGPGPATKPAKRAGEEGGQGPAGVATVGRRRRHEGEFLARARGALGAVPDDAGRTAGPAQRLDIQLQTRRPRYAKSRRLMSHAVARCAAMKSSARRRGCRNRSTICDRRHSDAQARRRSAEPGSTPRIPFSISPGIAAGNCEVACVLDRSTSGPCDPAACRQVYRVSVRHVRSGGAITTAAVLVEDTQESGTRAMRPDGVCRRQALASDSHRDCRPPGIPDRPVLRGLSSRPGPWSFRGDASGAGVDRGSRRAVVRHCPGFSVEDPVLYLTGDGNRSIARNPEAAQERRGRLRPGPRSRSPTSSPAASPTHSAP